MSGASAWKERSIYQIITDRFAVTGHGTGGPDIDYLSRQYCGGTWQGIISKLDYIQGMGFDAIWISPVTKNIEDNTHYGTGYHGYWQEDFYSVNPNFGTAEDLLALSDALHARGMFLMVDVVVNHMASDTTKVDFSRFTPFNHSSYFHSEYFITNYDDQRQCEEGWLGDKHVPLPDLDTENPTVAHTLHAWISALVRKFHIDGLRIDTVKHVPKEFWPGFIRTAGVWAVGEVLSGDPDYLSSYQSYLGGLLDYGTYYPLKRAFKTGSGSMYEITNLLQPEYRRKWGDMQQLATFMENHDMPRFTRDTSSDLAVVKNALAWTILTDGIPIVYYGQEQSFSGKSRLDDDQDARQLMWSSGYKITPLYRYIALLNQVRKLSWNAGFGSNLTIPLHTDLNVAATQKGPLLMVLSNEGSGSRPRKFATVTSFPPGTLLVDVLTSQSVTVRSYTNITVVDGQPLIYLPYALASRIVQNITHPPISPIAKFFSFFRSSASSDTASGGITAWSTGVPVNTRNILRPSRIDVSSGRILQPSPHSTLSKYSIFSTASESKPVSRRAASPRGDDRYPKEGSQRWPPPVTTSRNTHT